MFDAIVERHPTAQCEAREYAVADEGPANPIGESNPAAA